MGVLAWPVFASRRAPVKSASALLSQAKIEMRASPPRYESALDYLDTVLAIAGPMPEAYFYRGNIYGEFAIREYDLKKKIKILEKMALSYDSTYFSCDSKDVNKKLKKECKEYKSIIDSIRIFYWKDSYNAGVQKINVMDNELIPAVKNAADSAAKETAKAALQGAADTSKLHFRAGIAVDRRDFRAYEGIGIVFDRLNKYDSSAAWFQKASNLAPDTTHLIQNIAYAYIQSSDWETSIKYFKKLLDKVPEDANTMLNIAICFNNLRMYDSSHIYNLKAIEIDSTLAGAYVDVGQYFLLRSQEFADSIRIYQKENKGERADKFIKKRDNMFDSSAAFFKKGIELEPDNVLALDNYSLIMLIVGDYGEAEKCFKKLTELESYNKEHWISLGETYIRQEMFAEAISPFEKATELDPGDARIWETLEMLYEAEGLTDKAKEAKARAEELNNL
jgi:tetratricopeptide (TPR) repeat protein